VFFFEKKNQKTFTSSPSQQPGTVGLNAHLNEQKFFGSFFQKRTLPSFFVPMTTTRAAAIIM
jgi:hypothetical protein